jgi:hypothetical protein
LTTLSVSPANVVLGSEQNAIFSVTVVPGPHLTGTPTGTVEVQTGKTKICSMTIVAGKEADA